MEECWQATVEKGNCFLGSVVNNLILNFRLSSPNILLEFKVKFASQSLNTNGQR